MPRFHSREEYERWKAGGSDHLQPPETQAPEPPPLKPPPPVNDSRPSRAWMVPVVLLALLVGAWLLLKRAPEVAEEREAVAENEERIEVPVLTGPVNRSLGLSLEYLVQPGASRDVEFYLLSPTPPSAGRLVVPPTVGALKMTQDLIPGRGVEVFVKNIRTETVESSAWFINTFGLVDFERGRITNRRSNYRGVRLESGLWFEQWPDSEEYRPSEALFSLTPGTWQVPDSLRYVMSGCVSEAQVRSVFKTMVKDQAPAHFVGLQQGAQQADLRRGKIAATLVVATFQVNVDKSNDISRIGGDGAQHIVFEDGAKTLRFWIHVMRNGPNRPLTIVGPKITPETLARFARARFQAFARR